MPSRHESFCDDITFRPHRLGFYLWLAAILGLGLTSLILSAQLHPVWLIGALLATYAGAAGVSRYSAGSLGLRGYDLVLYHGMFVSREVAFPIWQTHLEIRQTILGRRLDAGKVVVRVGEERFVARVSQLRALRRLAAERKVALLTLAERHALALPRSQPYAIAGERERQTW